LHIWLKNCNVCYYHCLDLSVLHLTFCSDLTRLSFDFIKHEKHYWNKYLLVKQPLVKISAQAGTFLTMVMISLVMLIVLIVPWRVRRFAFKGGKSTAELSN
jgi:hypothetical protein